MANKPAQAIHLYFLIQFEINVAAVAINAIERTNPSIDDQELRWVSDRIERWEGDERILTKEEMQIANLYWKKYNNK